MERDQRDNELENAMVSQRDVRRSSLTIPAFIRVIRDIRGKEHAK